MSDSSRFGRVESERSVQRPLRAESERRPPVSGAAKPGRVGKGRVIEEQPRPLSEAYAGWMRWAKANLPGEHGPFVAAAAQMIRRAGGRPTVENIRARLREQGRTKEQLG